MERRIDRLEKYMIFKKLNDNQVTNDCGLSIGLLNQAKRGKSDLGNKSIDKILSTYQDLNRVWLLTGEGEMLNENNTKDSQDSQVGIPLIPQAAMAGALGGSDNQWMGYQCERYLIPGFEDCDFLIRIEGDSMMPDYYPGDIVAYLCCDFDCVCCLTCVVPCSLVRGDTQRVGCL